MATSKIKMGAIPSRELGVVTDLNISGRTVGDISHFTFNAGAANAPYSSAGGHGLLFTNSDSANYGVEIAVTNFGIKARKLNGGAFESWNTIINI